MKKFTQIVYWETRLVFEDFFAFVVLLKLKSKTPKLCFKIQAILLNFMFSILKHLFGFPYDYLVSVIDQNYDCTLETCWQFSTFLY